MLGRLTAKLKVDLFDIFYLEIDHERALKPEFLKKLKRSKFDLTCVVHKLCPTKKYLEGYKSKYRETKISKRIQVD